MTQTPSVGRIVHYQSENLPVAAIITAVDDGRVTLSVFGPNEAPGYLRVRTIYGDDTSPFTQWVPFAEEPTPGHWNWPPRI